MISGRNKQSTGAKYQLGRTSALLCVLMMVAAACGGSTTPTTGDTTQTTAGQSSTTTGASTSGGYEGVDEIDPVTLVVTDIAPESAPQGAAYRAFADRIAEASDGRIEFEFHWAGSYLSGQEAPEGIGAGVADMGFFPVGYVPETLPVTAWTIGFASTYDSSFPVGTLQGVGAHAEQLLDSPDVIAEFDSLNLQLLTPLVLTQFFDLTCTKPVVTLEDAAGTSIRVSNAVYAAEAEALGMVPTNIEALEMYEALERGVVDCVAQWPPISTPLGLMDVGTDYTPLQLNGFNEFVLVMNKDTWNSLPAVGQQIIWDNLGLLVRTYHEEVQSYYQQWAEEGPDNGLSFHAPSDELATALSDFQEQSVAEMPSNAPAGVSDPQQFFDDYLAAVEKWSGIIVDDLGYPVFGTSAEETIESFSAELDLDAFQQAMEEMVYGPRRP